MNTWPREEGSLKGSMTTGTHVWTAKITTSSNVQWCLMTTSTPVASCFWPPLRVVLICSTSHYLSLPLPSTTYLSTSSIFPLSPLTGFCFIPWLMVHSNWQCVLPLLPLSYIFFDCTAPLLGHYYLCLTPCLKTLISCSLCSPFLIHISRFPNSHCLNFLNLGPVTFLIRLHICLCPLGNSIINTCKTHHNKYIVLGM